MPEFANVEAEFAPMLGQNLPRAEPEYVEVGQTLLMHSQNLLGLSQLCQC